MAVVSPYFKKLG